jgi:hypothetical protein
LLLGEELLDALDEVLVGGFVGGYELAEFGDDVEGVLPVDLPEDCVLDFGEFQTHESSTEFQDPFCLFEGFSGPWDVSQTE